MNDLFSGYKYKVMNIDGLTDYVVVALYESISDAKGYEIRTESIHCVAVQENENYEDTALSIYYDKVRYKQ